MCCGPGDSAYNRGKRRAPGSPDARCSKRSGDVQTARARVAAGLGTRQSPACADAETVNADKWSSNVYVAAVCKIATNRAGSESTTGPTAVASAAASVAEAAVTAENLQLLEEADTMCFEALHEHYVAQ